MKCTLCQRTVGNSEYLHSRSRPHLSLLKKRMLYYKQLCVKEHGYYKYDPQLWRAEKGKMILL